MAPALKIRGSSRAAWLAAATLLALTLLAYLPVLQAGWIWDDDDYVTENEALRSVDGLLRIWTDTATTPQYYPLTHTSFWLQYQLTGLDPLAFHLVNVLLHGLSAVLLWRVLARLGLPAAWLAAALFAIHPVQVESVAWVTERKNVLSGLFYLAAAAVFLRGALPSEGAGATGRGRWWRHGAPALGLFGAALLSKTVTASLPVALALALWWRRGRLRAWETTVLAVMLVGGAGLGLLTAWLEQTQVLAQGAAWDLDFVERSLIAGRAVWFYLYKLVWPVGLAFIYERWAIDAAVAWQYLFPLAGLALVAVLALGARRWGRGPLVAWLFFGVTLSPALGFLNVYPMRYSFVADHFQYLACIGPLALISTGLWSIGLRLPPTARRFGAATVLAALAGLAFAQARTYRDAETLWRTTIERSPRAWMAHYNLGRLLHGRGQPGAALEPYRTATELAPDLIEARISLGAALVALERHAEAVAPLRQALALDPRSGLAHYNLALALRQLGRNEEAVDHLRQAVRWQPGLGQAHYNLAVHLYGQAAYAEAWESLQQARAHGYAPNPDFVRALESELRP